MDNEIWKDIEGYEGRYQVSNLGQVRSCNRIVKFKDGREREYKSVILRPTTDKDGYYIFYLYKNKKKTNFSAHKLVAQTFIPNTDNKPQINHKNGNKTDNRAVNLEWVTPLENTQHAIKTNLRQALKGQYSPTAKLTNVQAKKIREEYIPRDKKYGLKVLAKKYKMNPSTIHSIIYHKSYKEI